MPTGKAFCAIRQQDPKLGNPKGRKFLPFPLHESRIDLPDDLAGELGVLTAHIGRHIEALPNITRAHVYRIGDGGAHLHVWFLARPCGQAQLHGSWLVGWDDLLPLYPDQVAAADAAVVAEALVGSYGGDRGLTVG